MSLHNIPADLDIERARMLASRYLRSPSGIVYGDGPESPPTAVEFTPDITTEEQPLLLAVVDFCRKRQTAEALINAQDVRARFDLHVLKGKTPAEIYTIVQARIDSWGSLAAAKQDFRDWMPLLFAAVAWMVMERDGD